MYSHENYLWGLVAYGLGFLLILPLMLRFSRFVVPWKPLRNLILLFMLALLLTPVKAYNDMHFLAPAWMVALFESVQPSSVEGPARALTPIVVVFVGLVAVYIGWLLLRRYVFTPRQQAKGDYRNFSEVVNDTKNTGDGQTSTDH